MGLFDSVRRRRELEKLEREAAENPSPLTLSTLAERYIAFGETDKSLEVAKRAVETFPDSERVLTTYRYIVKSHLQSRILDLQRSIDKSPTPAGFARLAEIHYKELVDRDTALEICRRGIALYPDDESLHLIHGQIRSDRFHEDFQVKDGTQAVEHLERTAVLNAQNYKALLLLCRLYGEIGAYARAMETAQRILRSAPQDDKARALADRLAGVPKGKLEDEDVDLLFREVERRGGLDEAGKAFGALHDTEAGPRVGGADMNLDSSRVRSIVQRFENLEGLVAAVVLSPDGRLIAGQGRPEVPLELLGQVAQAIILTAEESSKRMDIGSFQRGMMEGSFGRMHLVQLRSLFLCVLTTATVKPDQARQAVERFLDAVAKAQAAPEKV
ncbi:MAG: tetratricopeptide repeat protein [Planctomycetes bacterium]|nr:tetratricopeptide repeat protein [Planctomycetota bacterium]